MVAFAESEMEFISHNEFKQLGFSYIPGASITPDVEAAEQKMVKP